MNRTNPLVSRNNMLFLPGCVVEKTVLCGLLEETGFLVGTAIEWDEGSVCEKVSAFD